MLCKFMERLLPTSSHLFIQVFIHLYNKVPGIGLHLKDSPGDFQYISQQSIGSWKPCWTFCWRVVPIPVPEVNPLVT